MVTIKDEKMSQRNKNENRLVTNFSTYSYRRVDVRICTAKAYEKSLSGIVDRYVHVCTPPPDVVNNEQLICLGKHL